MGSVPGSLNAVNGILLTFALFVALTGRPWTFGATLAIMTWRFHHLVRLKQPSSGGKQGPPVPQPTGAPAPKITPKQRREATVADLGLQSPSSLPSTGGPRILPAQYTCDGKNTSPALRWQGVPHGTAELVLFAMNIRRRPQQLRQDGL